MPATIATHGPDGREILPCGCPYELAMLEQWCVLKGLWGMVRNPLSFHVMREDAASKDFARPLLPQADNQADTMAATIASVSVFEDKGVRHALAPISHPQSAGVAERAMIQYITRNHGIHQHAARSNPQVHTSGSDGEQDDRGFSDSCQTALPLSDFHARRVVAQAGISVEEEFSASESNHHDKAHDGRVPLPSPDLLKVHCAIADILHATGMAEKIDKILDDTEAALISQSCFQAKDAITRLNAYIEGKKVVPEEDDDELLVLSDKEDTPQDDGGLPIPTNLNLLTHWILERYETWLKPVHVHPCYISISLLSSWPETPHRELATNAPSLTNAQSKEELERKNNKKPAESDLDEDEEMFGDIAYVTVAHSTPGREITSSGGSSDGDTGPVEGDPLATMTPIRAVSQLKGLTMLVMASYETAYFHRAQRVPRAFQLTYGQVPIRVTDFEALKEAPMWAEGPPDEIMMSGQGPPSSCLKNLPGRIYRGISAANFSFEPPTSRNPWDLVQGGRSRTVNDLLS
ncbi:hypothetical protein CNMCM5793_009199 [Aspergillus hiratsukae]|uniref:Uncharacterized protein n=1 Tax=Aspergillus hiratsukae TaxID=1194566 RepID=A0A8H6PJL5_9EURO|nr:hypothetical protein CNMCM5793_009199 [Aspergillus hiratsukae]KAF7155672.1 hypothetical protein CNMCM6106_005954 [Aspergillus hiratsukae]